MADLLKKTINNKSLFKAVYLTVTVFFSVQFLEYVSYVAIFIVLIWGCYLTISDVVSKRVKKVFLGKYFAVFLGLGVLSNILSIIGGYANSFGIVIGIGMLIVTAQFMYLFFANKDDKSQTAKLEIYSISKILFYIISVLNTIGFVLLIVFHQLIEIFSKRLIIYDNRYSGIYMNPNMGAYNCFICIVCGVILLNKTFCGSINKKSLKLYVAIPFMAISYLSLMLSASRGAVLILTVFISVLVAYYFFYTITHKKTAKRTVAVILSIVFVILTPVAFFKGTFSSLTSYIIEKDNINIGEKVKRKATDYNDELHTKSGKITFEHITGKDDGSGRVEIYKKSFNLFLQKPILGWGNGNVLLMGDTEKSTIENVLLQGDYKIFEAHNAYLTILSTGGILSFIVFMFCGAIILLIIFLSAKKSFLNATLFAFITACCAYAFVEPSMVFYPSFVVATIWFFMGNAVAIAKEQIPDKLINKKFLK